MNQNHANQHQSSWRNVWMLHLLVIFNFSLKVINSLICGCCISFFLQAHGFLKTKLSETMIDTSYDWQIQGNLLKICYDSSDKIFQWTYGCPLSTSVLKIYWNEISHEWVHEKILANIIKIKWQSTVMEIKQLIQILHRFGLYTAQSLLL